MKSWHIVVSPVLVLALAACSKDTPELSSASGPAPAASSAAPALPAAHPAPPSAAQGAPAAAPPGQVADIAWDVPAAWQTAPNPSPMRKATYKIAKAAGDAEDAEMSVSQAGGSIEANTERWASQFGVGKDAVKETKRPAGPLEITVVEIKGTFAGSGMPGAPASGPKAHWELLGAIVEGTSPPYFFKLTGPEKTVTAARADFDKLVASVRAK